MSLAAAVALLSGCGADRAEESAPSSPAAGAAAAEATAREEVALVEAAGLLPPGARLVSRQPVEGAVAFDFVAAEAPPRLADWYRAARPGAAFSVSSEMEEGAERVLSGTTRSPAGDFSVRLAPDGRGGTMAMVLVTLNR